MDRRMNKKGMSEGFIAGVFAMLGIVGFILFCSISIIPDGQVGVYTLFGNVDDDEYTQGVYFMNPFATVEKVDIKQKTITETAVVPAKDGLSVTVDLSVIYRIKSTQASEIKQTVSGDITETKLKPIIRSTLRDVSSKQNAADIYSPEGREAVRLELSARLKDEIGSQLEIDSVLLRDVQLPPTVKAAIERKLDQQQKAQAKEFELEAAKLDAQIEITKAEGIAEANAVIAESITDEYLKYKFIEGLNDGYTEVVYVPTEANIPILEVNR